MSHHFTGLVTACGGDLQEQAACDPAQTRLVSLDEHGEALLNMERHEARADRVTDK